MAPDVVNELGCHACPVPVSKNYRRGLAVADPWHTESAALPASELAQVHALGNSNSGQRSMCRLISALACLACCGHAPARFAMRHIVVR